MQRLLNLQPLLPFVEVLPRWLQAGSCSRVEEAWNDDDQPKAGKSLQQLVKTWAAALVLLLYLSGLELSQSLLSTLRGQTLGFPF